MGNGKSSLEKPVVNSQLREHFEGRRVLVTGHTGFKGSWLSLWLSELGAEVTGFALPPEYSNSHFQLLDLERRINHVEGDLRDENLVQGVFRSARPEVVFHLAAQALVRRSYQDPKSTFDINVSGSVNLLEAVCNSSDVRSVIFVTSDKCYSNKEWIWGYRENDELGGDDPYSASKAAAEMVFFAYYQSFFKVRPDLGAASVRAGNVIGGGDWAADRIVPDCVRALDAGTPIKLRNPEATRPWQHVLDPLHGYLRLAANLLEMPSKFGGAWNFGPDLKTGRTVKQLAEIAISIWGHGQIITQHAENEPFEHRLLQLNIDKSRLNLGWQPCWSSDQAILEAISWYKRFRSGEIPEEISLSQILAFMEQIK